ncbi:MAG: DUF4406 domain-containing protein [Ancrocorticia sp.]|nr:DUF4406 domain-containing protein [Ancrocorticia sp.]MCI1962913.1 DUF4406 domain-containing protein [Ancrocorticia sp.]MCI2001807.1 DUF4406 domain-containing protein [Ancrocorticia sp.]MCI2001860.1 DUF4406 domain-containing protein [Ancrocorticia sp.]
MRIYISGPMSKLPNYNRAAFAAAERNLTQRGHEVLNPARIRLSANASWEDYMRIAIRLLTHADAVCLLPGWEGSLGATIEHRLADFLKIETRPTTYWADVVLHTHAERSGVSLRLEREGRYYRLHYTDKRGRAHSQAFTSYTRAHQAYLQQKNAL